MCKFNQNLFIISIILCFVWLKSFKSLNAAPIDYALLDDLISNDESTNDFDVAYDQRQNGTENLRLRIDGLILAFPSAASSQASSMAASLATNYLLQLATAEDDDNEDEIPDSFASLLKNSNSDNIVTAPTVPTEKEQSLNKDERLTKKKVIVRTESPKESTVKRVIGLNVKDDLVADLAAAQRINPINDAEDSKLVVVPVKKIQSRRKNK